MIPRYFPGNNPRCSESMTIGSRVTSCDDDAAAPEEKVSRKSFSAVVAWPKPLQNAGRIVIGCDTAIGCIAEGMSAALGGSVISCPMVCAVDRLLIRLKCWQ